MSETTESAEETPAAKPANPKKIAAIIAAILVFTIFFWLFASRLMGIRAAEREGLENAAVVLAGSTLPLLDLRSKNLLGDDNTLQRIVDGLAENHRFSFAAILDNQGRVVASSDRGIAVGDTYPDFKAGEFVERGVEGKHEVIQPIKQDTVTYGAVVLREP